MADPYRLNGSKRLRVRVGRITDDYDNEAQVEGGFVWTAAPEGVGAVVTLDQDGRDVAFDCTGVVAQGGMLEGRADAAFGPDVVPLIVAVPFVVEAGMARFVSFDVAVEDKPAAPAPETPPA